MKPNRNSSAVTKADSTTTADDMQVSQTIAKPNVISRFSVSLFFRRTDEFAVSKTIKERLICKIVSAKNEDEAFGIAYKITKVQFENFDLVYQLTVPIPNEEPKQMADNFKQMRIEKGMTLREVEKATGISNSYLSQLETGKIKKPSYSVVTQLNALYANGL